MRTAEWRESHSPRDAAAAGQVGVLALGLGRDPGRGAGRRRGTLCGGARLRTWREVHRKDPRVPYTVLTVISLWLAAGPPVALWPFVYWPKFKKP